MEPASIINLVVRFANDKGAKRDLHRRVPLTSTLAKVAELLAKECETESSCLTFSLEGKALNQSLTLKQAYGTTPFAVVLDARVEQGNEKRSSVCSICSKKILPGAVCCTRCGTFVKESKLAPSSPSAQQKPPKPQVSYLYVDAARVNKKLICSVSREPAVEARVHTGCNNLFNLKDISKWLESNDACPMCRCKCTLADFQENPLIQNLLDELHVHCSNKEQGCNWTGERGSLAEHLERFCSMNVCPSDGCKFQGPMQKVQVHLDVDCDFMKVSCPEGCEVVLQRRHVTGHVRSSCTEVKRRHLEREKELSRLTEERKRQEALRAAEEAKRRQKSLEKELLSLCDKLNPEPVNVVTLDVGGKIFKTSRETLIKYPMSVLGVMFSSSSRRKLKCNAEGVVFLDAPPKVFAYVLAWLQRGTIPKGGCDGLLEEAKRWHLNELVKALGGEVVGNRAGAKVSQVSNGTQEKSKALKKTVHASRVQKETSVNMQHAALHELLDGVDSDEEWQLDFVLNRK